MKRFLPLFAVLVLLLSACTIRFDVQLEVNEDESGTFALFMGFDEEFQQLMEQGGGEGLDITEGLADVPEGWTVEEVEEDGFEGVRISTEFSDLEDLERRLSDLGEGQDSGIGTDFLGDFGLTHEGDEFRFEVDVSGLDEELSGAVGDSGGEDLLSGLDPATLFEDLFEIRFNLTLPGTIQSHNADAINGNTLTWNVDITDEGTTYQAVSTTGGGGSSLLLIGGVAAVVVIGGGAVIAMNRRRKTAAVEAVNAAPTSLDAPPIDPVD
ncbi:MAG: hypothetical protein QNJ77_10790 [Acidimicrobiia bacterium]|nr:hypothetical protein [Acidimicrobiia bacterium]